MVVIQSITGKLNIYSTPGLKMRDFGNVTVYEKNNQYSFSGKEDSLQEDNSSIGIRFNDGGTAKLSGSALWILPSDPKSIRIIHNFYGSQKEVERRLIRASLEKAAGFTGLLMSTKESLTTRRSEMIDSIFNKSSKGLVISDGVRIYNLVINNVEYDSTVLSSLIRSEIAKLSADGDIYKKGIISNPSETLAKRLEVYETLNKKMEKALKK
jgi:hypothetical protein